MLGTDQGGIEVARWSNFRPAPTATIVRLGPPGTPGTFTDLDVIAALPQNGVTDLVIDGTNIDLDAAPYNLQTTGAADPWVSNPAGMSAVTADNDGVREKLRIIANAITNNADISFKAEVWGYTLALEATDGTINNLPSTIASIPAVTQFGTAGNRVVPNVRLYTLGPNPGPNTFSTPGTEGDDGTAPIPADYIGSEAQQTGFHALDPMELFNLMVLPGDEEVDEAAMTSVLGPASNYCERNRAFLLIDSPQSWTDNQNRPAVVQDTGLVNDLRATIVNDHSAVFYPRLRFNDAGLTRTIGASGAIAGLMARTDSNRGVWKAPAGIEADIRDIIGVNLELTDAENGVLNKKGVNCVRIFPNGIVNWGGRTLDGDDDFGSEWKYIPIRRLALMIEESLYRGTRWAVFEPNDEPLWANLRLNIGAFMFSLFRQGAFQGSGPAEAYFVKCDKETTTQDDRNKGIVNIEVGFAPLKPAEFVVIKIQQMAGEIQT
jgi:phage tail sheath protein FI